LTVEHPYKFLCTSDTHGHVPPPLDETCATAWLHAGDVYSGKVLHSRSLISNKVRLWKSASEVPVYAVRGNHDYTDPLGIFDMDMDITGRVVRIAPDVLIAGIGWHGGKYYDLPMDKNDIAPIVQGILRILLRELLPSDRLILLTHYPPALPDFETEFPRNWIADHGWVYPSIRSFIDEFNPAAVVMGHIHDWAGKSARLDVGSTSTLILNPGAEGMTFTLDGKQANLVS